jgi:hypothetical protein
MRFNKFTITKTVKETICIATGEVLDVQILHQDTNLKSILRNMGFKFDGCGNNPYYSKALRLQRKGLALHEVIHKILLELEDKIKLQEEVSA